MDLNQQTFASVAADLGATMANIQDDWQGWNEIEDKDAFAVLWCLRNLFWRKHG